MAPDDDGSVPPNAGERASLYRYRFGTAEFDTARNELRVDGRPVELQQKPLQLLAMLLASPGEVVSKTALFHEVWADRATGDAVLNNAASKLRAALGARNAAAIVTVPRRGYRFDGPVDRMAVGRRHARHVALAPGVPVPGRESYLLRRLLGRSAVSEAWIAAHPKTGELRVFKFATDGERLDGLKREVTLYRVLHESLGAHPGVVRVYDWNFRRPPCWLECEHAGRDLDAWAIEPDGDTLRLAATDRPERLALFLQLADTVAAIHGAGVAHEDLKPANVLVDSEGPGWRLRLTDFGSGRLLEPEQLERLRITRLGMTLAPGDAATGTPFYMAPEIGRGAPPTLRSDIFSLGVILYQLLAGDLRRPMVSGWERDIADELLQEDILAATDVDPERRLASAAEFADRVSHLDSRRALRARERAAEARAAEVQRRLVRARERRNAVRLAQQVELSQALSRFLREDLIGAANPALNGRADITVADALTQAAGRIDEKFAMLDPAVRGSLHATMQLALGELSRSTDAVAAGQRALAALRLAPGVDLDELQAVRLGLVLDLYGVSRLDDARAVIADIEAAPPTPGSASPLFQARMLYAKSCLHAADLSLEESQQKLQQAYALIEPLGHSDAAIGLREKVMFALANDLSMLGRPAEGEVIYRRLLEEQTQRLGEQHYMTLFTLIGLANTFNMAGRPADALEVLKRAVPSLERTLGPGHRYTVSGHYMQGGARYRLRDYEAAADAYERARRGHAMLQGESSVTAISAQTNAGMALLYAGRPAQAEPVLRDALVHVRASLSDQAPQSQQIRYALASCLVALQRVDEAMPLLEGLSIEALELAEPEPDWPARFDYLHSHVAMACGDRTRALALMERAARGLCEEGDMHAGVARDMLARWRAEA